VEESKRPKDLTEELHKSFEEIFDEGTEACSKVDKWRQVERENPCCEIPLPDNWDGRKEES